MKVLKGVEKATTKMEPGETCLQAQPVLTVLLAQLAPEWGSLMLWWVQDPQEFPLLKSLTSSFVNKGLSISLLFLRSCL